MHATQMIVSLLMIRRSKLEVSASVIVVSKIASIVCDLDEWVDRREMAR